MGARMVPSEGWTMPMHWRHIAQSRPALDPWYPWGKGTGGSDPRIILLAWRLFIGWVTYVPRCSKFSEVGLPLELSRVALRACTIGMVAVLIDPCHDGAGWGTPEPVGAGGGPILYPRWNCACGMCPPLSPWLSLVGASSESPAFLGPLPLATSPGHFPWPLLLATYIVGPLD